MTQSLTTRLKLLGCFILPNAGLLLKVLNRTREQALSAAKRVDSAQFHLETTIIKLILRRKLFFSKTERDLSNLVIFCGNPEFYDREILGTVLAGVLPYAKGFFGCYRMCAAILSTRESVCHYFSRCNKDRLSIGSTRLTEFLLDWLVRLLRIRPELLSIMDPNILYEILRRGTKDVYGVALSDLRYWECANDDGVSPYVIADFLYVCLRALYQVDVCKQPAGIPVPSSASRNIIRCISTAVRAVPGIPLELVYARAKVLHNCTNAELVVGKSLSWLLRSSLVPNFREALGVQVHSLKHLARCKVRTALYDNWALPEGIYKLNLPDSLQRYLDMEYD